MKTNESGRGLIVLSGGMDSTTLLYEYQEDIVLALSFDYGSKHNHQEIPMARLHCERIGVQHIVIPLGFMVEHFQSSLLLGGRDIPHAAYDADNIRSTVVPFRNGIMLSIAAGLAESHALERIYIANHFGDHAIYPDCRSSFITPMTQAICQGTTNGVRIIAPYTDITKGDIARIGKRLGLDYSQTWSCYEGRERHCGTCATCLERIEALAEAAIEDTTQYEGSML
ncbi:MAG: 7-cyano-7-deazaguanine synthase QueC [Porphyromonadaceae bacterium]|nr:7-cyano-7-deazaguanine synthase QueC [Porphyromonadaceae bacterium]